MTGPDENYTPDAAALDVYTAEGIAALDKGDKELADQIFAERDAVAKGEASAEAFANEPTSADDVLDLLRDHGGAAGQDLAGVFAGWDADTQVGLAYAAADQIRRDNPEVYQRMLEVDDEDVPELISDLRSRAKELGLAPLKFNRGAQAQMQHPDTEPASFREQAGARDALEQLLDEHPPGTPGYLKPSVQREVRRLHVAISGDRPVVGRNLRSY